MKNKEAAASLVTFLTDHDRQMVEARTGLLPTRTQVWDDAKAEFEADGRDFMVEVFDTYAISMAEDSFTPPLIPNGSRFRTLCGSASGGDGR